MSRTLKVVDHLLTAGRTRQQLGRDRDALHILGRLAGFRELPAEVAEMTQVLFAEVYLRHRKYRRARRHLTAALQHRPDSARYHYLMAAALDADDKADPQRAADHYRRSLELDPDQPRCLAEYGLLAVRLGETEAGLDALRRAVELAPDDPAMLALLVKGLRLANRVEEARSALRAALFRNARDARFRKLWDDFRFHELRREQEAAHRRPPDGATDGPVLLPFVRPAPRSAGGKIIRHDPPAPAPHSRGPRSIRKPDQRHAQ